MAHDAVPSTLQHAMLSRSPSIISNLNAGRASNTDHPWLPTAQRHTSNVYSHRTTAPVVVMQARNSTSNTLEGELEESILANRRRLDETKALLDEIIIDKILGFGSMGMVYFGRLWDTKVVVKMIEHGAGVLGKEQNRGRLARAEAVVSRMLLHPNVLVTYDCCTGPVDTGRLSKVSGTPGRGATRGGRQRCMTVMVQEFCEMGTLRDAINKQKLGLNKSAPHYHDLVLGLCLDIANGMRYLASLRILHVDLKAENVLLQKLNSPIDITGPGGTTGQQRNYMAKIADFGLTQVLPAEVEELHTGIHGTVSHMPPEAMRSPPTFSLATDVFSFGVVMWELITQDRPFTGMAAHQVIEAVVEHQERLPWPADAHPGLRALAEECWEADPHSRPSFPEVCERLRAMASGKEKLKRAPSQLSEGMTDESDELEQALRAQRKQQPAGQGAGGTAASQLQRALSSRSSDMGISRAPSGLDNQAGGARELPSQPPKDALGRMLWFLCQAPPPADALELVSLSDPPGTVQWVAKVDVSGAREREEALAAASGAAA